MRLRTSRDFAKSRPAAGFGNSRVSSGDRRSERRSSLAQVPTTMTVKPPKHKPKLKSSMR